MVEKETTTEELVKDAADARRVRQRNLVIAGSVVGVAGVAVLVILLWYFAGQGESGKPVPAPRISMTDATADQGAVPTDQTITLSPEQVQNAGIAFETVGEQLSTESESV